MHPQIIQNSKGEETGVFIPIDEWNLIKENYPDIEELNEEIPDWHKELLTQRLDTIKSNPDSLLPIDSLLDELDKD
jgi:hypothetical protein